MTLFHLTRVVRRPRRRPGARPTLPSPDGGLRGRAVHTSSPGQVLLMAIIVMVVGIGMVVPVTSQLSTMLQRGGTEREQHMKVYADESTIGRVIADLIRGADGVGTTYTTTAPRGTPTFTITTSYNAPSVTVNDYTPTVTLSLPTSSQAVPTTQQNYVDPGVTHPQLASIPPSTGYVMRLYNVKAGTLQANWAYSPAGISRVGVWAGVPTDNSNVPYPPGQIAAFPSQHPILDISSTPAGATYARTAAIAVDPATDGSGGVYTIVFFNKDSNTTRTTAAFGASGDTSDTWVYVKAYKDYIVTATVGGVSVSVFVRQVPGFTEPPAVVSGGGTTYTYTFATSNVAFITNEVFAYTWLSP